MAVFVRKILAILIACLLCAPAALAEEAALSGDFERLAEETGAEWQEDGAPRPVGARAGEASLHVCLREGEIVAATVKAPLGEGSAELIRAAIEPLGWLDEAALTALGRLSNGSSEASNGFVYGLIEGENARGVLGVPGGRVRRAGLAAGARRGKNTTIRPRAARWTSRGS